MEEGEIYGLLSEECTLHVYGEIYLEINCLGRECLHCMRVEFADIAALFKRVFKKASNDLSITDFRTQVNQSNITKIYI